MHLAEDTLRFLSGQARGDGTAFSRHRAPWRCTTAL